MNLRILLVIAAVMALLLVIAAWWGTGDGSAGVERVDLPADPANGRAVEPADLGNPPAASSDEGTPASAARAEATRTQAALPRPAPLTARIVGKVTSQSDNRPIQGAAVSAMLQDVFAGPALDYDVRTNLEGMYEIPDPGDGTWILECRAPGHRTADRKSVLLQPGSKERVCDFVLVPGGADRSVMVRLRAPDGRPFFETVTGTDVEIAALIRPIFVRKCPTRGADLPGDSRVIASRASGARVPRSDEWFRVKLDELDAACCCAVLGDRVLDAALVASNASTVILVVSPEDLQSMTGSLLVTVVDDSTGSAVPGAHVAVRPATGSGRAGKTDEKGQARFDRLMVGEAEVEVHAEGYSSVRQRHMIRAGAEMVVPAIRLGQSVSISGWVDMPPKGLQPMPSVYVMLYRVVNGVMELNPTAMAVHTPPGMKGAPNRIDEHGAFTFEAIDAGTYILGWNDRESRPLVVHVQRGEVPGWVQVDARLADVKGIHLAITEEMWEAVSKPGAPAKPAPAKR